MSGLAHLVHLQPQTVPSAPLTAPSIFKLTLSCIRKLARSGVRLVPAGQKLCMEFEWPGPEEWKPQTTEELGRLGTPSIGEGTGLEGGDWNGGEMNWNGRRVQS